MTWCKALFDELDEGEFGSVSLADDSELAIKGMGKLTLKVAGEDGERVLRLHDVLWVPDLTSNLLSVMRAVEGDIRFELAPGGMRMGCEGDMSVLAPHVKERGGCILTTEIKGRQATAQHVRTGGASLEARLLHQRKGHSSPKVAGVMWDKGCTKGTAVSKSALIKASHDCDNCKQGNGVRAPFPHSETVSHRRLSLVHVDVIGPMEEGTGGDGEKYTLIIVDSASRKVWANPMTAKGNALTVFLDWVRRAQKETGKQLVVVRSDNGGEFINRQSQDWAKELGVWWETTNPYTSQQNGVAERWNRTLQDRMRAMLLTSGLDSSYWPHAMRAAAYVLNRTPRLKDGGHIPEEIWTGRKVDLSNLRVFGCLCWPLVQSAQRKGKLALRRVPAVFLGYGETTKGWKVYIPSKSTHRMGTSRDVIFDEDRRYQDLPVPRKTGSLDDVLEWHDEWSLVEDRDEERGDQWSGEGVGAAGAEEAAGPVGVEGEGGLTKDGAQEERQADDRRVVESAERDAGDVAVLDADAEGVGDGGGRRARRDSSPRAATAARPNRRPSQF
ncbi:unnamed protein product [Tilletia caries]|nr:unnamed protein product [Tilletia caries]